MRQFERRRRTRWDSRPENGDESGKKQTKNGEMGEYSSEEQKRNQWRKGQPVREFMKASAKAFGG
jgi:hypothetical protein